MPSEGEGRTAAATAAVAALPEEWRRALPRSLRLRAPQACGLRAVQDGASFVHVAATGSGKGIVAFLPALVSSLEGQRDRADGLAPLPPVDVMIVPTIPLGLNHEVAFDKLYRDSAHPLTARFQARGVFVVRTAEAAGGVDAVASRATSDREWVSVQASRGDNPPPPPAAPPSEGVGTVRGMPTTYPCRGTPGIPHCKMCACVDVTPPVDERGRMRGRQGRSSLCAWTCRRARAVLPSTAFPGKTVGLHTKAPSPPPSPIDKGEHRGRVGHVQRLSEG